MSRHQALQDRLSAIEAQLFVAPARQAPTHRPARLRHDAADGVSPVLQQLLAEVLPGALVLDWRQDGAVHAGRMAADGLVYRFRVDATGVGYRPAWDGIGERGWSLRSDSFLQLRGVRNDFRRRRGGTGQKRKCTTGYGCGSACISLQKECRISPSSAIGKGRLRRLQQLAAAGDQSAGSTASQVMASRGAAAAALQKDRTTQRVQKLLERPEIAEFLRTGKLPSGGANSSTEPGTVREMKPGEIGFDPSRFQYKINATATTGEVGSLSGVRKWAPNLSGVMSVWKDPADGKVYVVNGHNRLALANRLGAEAVTVRFLNAATATEARAIGALQNIAEGAGTPMDAAKFFRDTGIKSQQDMVRLGVKPDTDMVQLVGSAREKLGGKDWWKPESGWKDKLKRFAEAAADPKNSVLTNPGREDPGLAPKAKQQGINAQDVTTSKQQAAFARQQQQAAQAAGDQRGAQAWRKEERTVERNRLATAMNSSKQSQSSLFGVTEYDETMPLFKEQPASTGGSLAVQSGGGAAARPTAAPASKPGSIAGALRQSMEAMKAADIRQMGMIAEQLFEAGWTIDRRTRYRGMSKDQARDKFKAEFAQKMQAQASSPEAAARATAMRNRAGASGTVSGALKSVLEDMKAQDQRLNDLQKQTIDLRIQAEEQFGGEEGEDPSLGGGRPRRRIGGGRRDADILEARIDALRVQCATMSR
jgi:hypothetical protein